MVIYEGKTKPDIKNVQLLKLNSDITLEHGNQGGNILINPHIEKVFDENKDYLYPIPISERLLNPNLTQNPG
ncbi:RagB/SusD family nutrient uptake outer membrane protein [Tannerella forsythia]|uniref:RagB/SusD family nutrient uptake outer membrane protein n=1 Tax=Tannerella forsythia TaxID=28112 RepID=A0A3P1XUQ7_TANFO|nr:RagB/SusD family nutrient uptake outer membrane protein [Tannerella forsythia]